LGEVEFLPVLLAVLQSSTSRPVSSWKGFQADVGANVAELEGVGVADPKGQGFGGPEWQDGE
jgi:hypothetical protein